MGTENKVPEITIKALIISVILAIVLGAANAYLGLFTGTTVSASIPAVIVSLGILSFFKKANILENNIIQTAASSGEGVTAGIVFTIPALVMLGYWHSFNCLEVTIIASLGGFLGVLFTIPLRRALIIEANLKYPEGTATAAVLKAAYSYKDSNPNNGTEKKPMSKNIHLLCFSAGVGGFFKLFTEGFQFWKSELCGSLSFGKSIFGGSLGLSPALLGVGYMVGIEVSITLFLGSAIIWWIGVPVYSYCYLELSDLTFESAAAIWNAHLTYIAIGGMLTGGAYAIYKLISPMIIGIKSSIQAYSNINKGKTIPRQERDIPITWVGVLILLSIIPLFIYFLKFFNHTWVAFIIAIIIIIFAFLFSSMGGYITGIVGASNTPTSSIAIATILFSTFVFIIILGAKAPGIAGGAILLGAVIASAGAIAGDNMQDLKAGYLLGATPWKQQVMQMVGTIAAAMAVGWTLNILNSAYVIGSDKLPAPQAVLMKSIVIAILGGNMPWNMILIGVAIALVIIFINSILEKKNTKLRISPLTLALGAYLPMSTTSGILLGGILYYFAEKHNRTQEQAPNGILFASGLIAGEALR